MLMYIWFLIVVSGLPLQKLPEKLQILKAAPVVFIILSSISQIFQV